MPRGLMLARPQTFDAKQISTCIEPAHLEANHHDHAITHMHCTIMACLLLISTPALCRGPFTFDAKRFDTGLAMEV